MLSLASFEPGMNGFRKVVEITVKRRLNGFSCLKFSQGNRSGYFQATLGVYSRESDDVLSL
jgi:hypothetical protein